MSDEKLNNSLSKIKNRVAYEHPFYLDLTRFYIIWFSKKPHEFMGETKKQQLMEMRKNNPKAELSFIYSNKSLTDVAKKNLLDFCEKQKPKIKPVAFEDLSKLMTDESDRALYDCAKTEIEKAIKEGGNLAAASDCTRHLKPVIEDYGMYVELGNTLELSADLAGETDFEILAPVVADLTFWKEEGFNGGQCYSCNGHVLGFSHVKGEPKKLDPQAEKGLRYIQQRIAENYKQAINLLIARIKEVKEKNDQKLDLDKIQQFLLNICPLLVNKTIKTVFDLRKYLESLEQSQEIEFLYTRLVSDITGGLNLLSMYKDCFDEPFPVSLAPSSVPGDDFRDMLNKSSFRSYDKLEPCIKATKTRLFHGANDGEAKDDVDLSWTPKGEKLLAERDKMLQQTIALGSAAAISVPGPAPGEIKHESSNDDDTAASEFARLSLIKTS